MGTPGGFGAGLTTKLGQGSVGEPLSPRPRPRQSLLAQHPGRVQPLHADPVGLWPASS